ncbi:MAG: IS200/IS605 family transposase [archaeon]
MIRPKIELIKHSHCVGESNIHYQLTPAYRRRIFADERVRKLTKAYLLTKAEELKVIIVSVDFGPDHMHFFVANCKNYSVADLIRRFKGFISRMMRKNHWGLFKQDLYGDKFWTAGYFYRSVGAVTADAIKFYIEHSQEKHWEVVDYEFYKYDQQRKLSEF